MLERDYQAKLIKKIKKRLPGSVVLKNDSGYIQGIPDLTVLYRNRWGTLEVKVDDTSAQQPNQQYYVDMMDDMSFSRFIHPGNEEAVLRDLQQSLESGGDARIS